MVQGVAFSVFGPPCYDCSLSSTFAYLIAFCSLPCSFGELKICTDSGEKVQHLRIVLPSSFPTLSTHHT